MPYAPKKKKKRKQQEYNTIQYNNTVSFYARYKFRLSVSCYITAEMWTVKNDNYEVHRRVISPSDWSIFIASKLKMYKNTGRSYFRLKCEPGSRIVSVTAVSNVRSPLAYML
jgi:hypothetical protein